VHIFEVISVMNIRWVVMGVLALMATAAQAADRPELKTEKDKYSYSIGLEVSRNFKKNGLEFDPALVIQGMNDGLSGERPLLTEKEFRKVMGDFQNAVRQRMVANRQAQTFENRKRATLFLEENKGKEGVNLMANGIQYKVLKAGTGPKPADADSVVFQYRGSLLDGTQFDGTDLGKPGTAKLVDLLNGFRAVVRQMPVGSHWLAWIPPHLGYGDRGVGNDVGPNELLVFDVELLGVRPPDMGR
jgi:FKBP-type peptidyl-prolyl cis-trans isomerase